MLYNLYNLIKDWLNDNGFGFFRLFDFLSFRAMLALIFSFLVVLMFGRFTTKQLLRLKIGDVPEFYNADLNELMKDADAACYMAKELGRNRTHVFHPEDQDLAKRSGEMQWVSRINHALDDDRYCIYA